MFRRDTLFLKHYLNYSYDFYSCNTYVVYSTIWINISTTMQLYEEGNTTKVSQIAMKTGSMWICDLKKIYLMDCN